MIEEQYEREVWCKAWRTLRQHGEQAEQLVRLEIEQALREKDSDKVRYRRDIAATISQLGR